MNSAQIARVHSFVERLQAIPAPADSAEVDECLQQMDQEITRIEGLYGEPSAE